MEVLLLPLPANAVPSFSQETENAICNHHSFVILIREPIRPSPCDS
jgi:hypothetical protein